MSSSIQTDDLKNYCIFLRKRKAVRLSSHKGNAENVPQGKTLVTKSLWEITRPNGSSKEELEGGEIMWV